MNTITRERGVTLRRLDLSKIEQAATRKYRAEKNDDTAYLEAGFGPYAVAEHNGATYVVCNEGVGWDVTEMGWTLDLYVRREGSIPIFPVMSATLNRDEVLACMTGETIDLSDLIRRFGERLETNFYLWHRTLTA